jgi:Carbohydrate family 9 binding domain-like/Glycosyl hydrolase family 99/Secretion system C-terminal sorting domain
MRNKSLLLVLFFAAFLSFNAQAQAPVNVTKTNTKPVYVHIMPWFNTPQTLGGNNWGYHWKMQTKNPNIIVDAATGKRQIASHYYPEIGPYDSSDPDVIDYQLLLMKLSGADGVLIDWYGTAGTVGDIAINLRNSDSIVSRSVPSGLKFALVIEDRFTGGNVTTQRNSMIYVRDNYFSKPNYIRYGAASDPLVGIFGPDQITGAANWTTILSGIEDIEFLPLEYKGTDVGTANRDGEYAWPYQAPNTSDHATQLENFYKFRAPGLKTVMGVLYPGFNDFYAQGEINGTSYFNIPHNGIATWTQTMNLANSYSNTLDMLQVATWNDYGEGTMIEPTQEFGYTFLVKLQQYTGVSYTENDLKQVTRFYKLRKQYPNDAVIKAKLNQVYKYFAALQISDAVALMCTIDNAAGCNTTSPQVTLVSSGAPREGSATGTFTFTGTNLTANTTVNYTIGGTTSAGDYTPNPTLSGSVQLTVAQPSVSLTITPVDDASYEVTETLILNITTNAAYTISQASATLSILDNDPVPCIAPVLAFTTTAPTIDQTIEATWTKAPIANLTKVSFGTFPTDFTGSRWRAMYDATYLYVLVEVKDNTKTNDSGVNWYLDDAVEIFIDGNNSKGTSYDGNNDFQIAFRYNDAAVYAGSGAIATAGISFAMQDIAGGYNLEARIPWSALNTTPSLGKSFGFEISVDDDDNGGTRDAQVSAFSTAGTAYNNPSIFGTVNTTNTCVDVVTAIDQAALNSFVLMPNPITDGQVTLILPNLDGEASVAIYNTQGMMIYQGSTKIINQESQLDLSSIKAGLYSIQLQKSNQVFIQKIVVQ